MKIKTTFFCTNNTKKNVKPNLKYKIKFLLFLCEIEILDIQFRQQQQQKRPSNYFLVVVTKFSISISIYSLSISDIV